MRRISVVCIALALAVGACSDSGDDDRPIDPRDVQLQIVSGDQQTAPVIGTPAGALAISGLSLQQSPGPITEADLFPEKLVVRAVTTSGSSKSESPLGLSFNVVPGTGAAGVSVTWRARPDGCGYAVETSTITDSDGESVNRWVRGTLATTCHLDVCRVLPTGEVACDETFEAVQEPGAVDNWQGFNNTRFDLPLNIGDTLDLRTLVERAWDAYDNEIPIDIVTALPNSLVAWTWSEPRNDPAGVQQGTGWTTEVPDGVALGYWRRTRIEYYAPRKSVWCWELDARLKLAISGASNNAGNSWTFPVAVPADAVSPDNDPLCRDLPPND